ncbi:hypothetical protein [Glycomyces sp. MUSA5-2]|uniref:hypothetical protein n=1 Tax=Glycomyces sp. MUSA5-2 TaxID=2053002 RepID=UPI0030094B38
MSQSDSTMHGVAQEFYCEHRARSRVVALVTIPGRLPVLTAVTTVTDPVAAEAIAQALTALAGEADHAAAAERLESIVSVLSDTTGAQVRAAAEAIALEATPVCTAVTPGEVNAYIKYRETGTEPCQQLEGIDDLEPVEVRITSELHLRVTAPADLITSATAAGWCPDPDEDDPLAHVRDAALYLAGPPRVPAGTRLIDHRSDTLDLDAAACHQETDQIDLAPAAVPLLDPRQPLFLAPETEQD